MVIMCYKDTARTPLKGLAIKQATDLMVRADTQAVTPIRSCIMIVDLIPDIPGIKGMRTSVDAVARSFK